MDTPQNNTENRIQSVFLKRKICIITENVAGEPYMIETDDYNYIINDWNDECKYVPVNDAKVFFASYDGVPINPYLYKDFESLLAHIRRLAP